MPPATGAFTEGVGPGDGCSRAGRAFLGMSFVLLVVRANFVGKKKAKKGGLKNNTTKKLLNLSRAI